MRSNFLLLFDSLTEDGYQWEEGPNSFQPSPTILRFAKDIGIIDDLILADSTLPRFVFWEGKLYPLPSKLSDPVLNFNLMTWPGKIRAGLGAIGLIAARPKEEESVKQFVTRHLGLYVCCANVQPPSPLSSPLLCLLFVILFFLYSLRHLFLISIISV